MAKLYNKVCAYCEYEIKFFHKQKPEICPSCGKNNWAKPDTEVQLFKLQKEFLKSRNSEVLGKMYLLLVEYASSSIKKIISGKFKYDSEWLSVKAHDATNSIINYYLSKVDFKIEQSFGSYLQWKVREVLYADKEEEMHDSLNTPNVDDDKEAIDLYSIKKYSSLYEYHDLIESIERNSFKKNELLDILMHFLKRRILKIKLYPIPLNTRYLSLICCVGLKLMLENKKAVLIDFYNIDKNNGGISQKLIDITDVDLYDLIRKESKV